MGFGSKRLFKWSRSHDQYGCHAHIYGKKFLKKSSLEPKRLMTLKVGMQHWVLEYYQVCSNDDWVDLDLFYGKVKFGSLCFCMGKS